MERATKTVTLPISGIKADIITRWLYSEYLEIEAIQTQAAKTVRMVNGEAVTDVDTSKVAQAGQRALQLAIKKLVGADGTELPITTETIGNLDMEDGIALKDAVDIIGAEQKKG